MLELHGRILARFGGLAGIRDFGLLESALAQPHLVLAGGEVHADLVEKAAALGYSLIRNHPFLDGNKRVGHAAMEALLMLNGQEIRADVDDAEAVVLAIATGERSREELTEWLRAHIVPCENA